MRRHLLSSAAQFTLLGLLTLVAIAPSACSSDEPPPNKEPGCLTSSECGKDQICADRQCVDAAAVGGSGGTASSGGGADDGGVASVVAIEVGGAAGQLGEDACVELCVAGRHCPGVDPHYDCDGSCSDSNAKVTAAGCDDEWSLVLRCSADRGPCAACQNELKVLYACIDKYCKDHQGADACSL